jgi:carbon-monoxide dehydrogenase medium subunit
MNQIAYAAPAKLSEVVALLSENPGSRILAGGQNLLVEPSRRHLSGSLLVDLRKVAGLVGIEERDGGVRIGSMTTIGAIASSELVHKICPVLAEAAGLVGDAQVRNRGTIGGAIVEANPGSDLIPVLLVLDAALEIAGTKSRQVAMNDFFAAQESNLSATEVISAIIIPRAAPSTGAIYEKMKHWATLYALCGVAAAVTLSSDGSIAQCRIAVTGSIEHPARLRDVEAALIGSRLEDSSLAKATSLIDRRLAYRGDAYASSEYRAHLTRVLTGRALRRASARASQ